MRLKQVLTLKQVLSFILGCLAFILVVSQQLWGAPAKAADRLVLVSIPSRDDETLSRRYAPLVELLGRKLGVKVEMEVSRDYKEIGERLSRRAADIGILGASAYVQAKDKYRDLVYLATCKQPDAFYTSLIISRTQSGIATLAELDNRSFGYTDLQSTSGYLYPRLMLKNAGLDPETLFARAYFLNKHDKVYDAVARGTIDAGGVSSTGWNEAIQRNGDVYRILSRSKPIPVNAVIASPHLPRERIDEIREILRRAEDDPIFTGSSGDLKGFVMKDDAFYDIVRRQLGLR